MRQTILAARKQTPEVARKLTFRISSVFKWAIAEGMRQDNPAIAQALALPRMENAPAHFKALPYQGRDELHRSHSGIRCRSFDKACT